MFSKIISLVDIVIHASTIFANMGEYDIAPSIYAV